MSRNGLWALIVLSLAVGACSDDDEGDRGTNDAGLHPDGGLPDGSLMDGSAVDNDAGDAAPNGDAGGDGGTSSDGGSPFPVNDAGQVLCGTGLVCACSNGIDEDADGLIDLADPECVSPWDNDESSFATGISGDNRDPYCQDCFFDGNSGSGNDGCRVATSCLTTEGDASSGHGSCMTCEATSQCKSFCEDYTPNGCDCFGCCAVQLGSNITENILIADGCNIDGSDLSGCTACVPSTTCVNTCGRCELCPGKTLADLPADCTGGGGGSTPTPSCDNGEPACGSGLPACGPDQVCTYGCCIYSPIIVI